MERTNYVHKAKQLLLETARTSALVIVPLAAAITAQANVIVSVPPLTSLPSGGFACSGGGACSGAGVSPISGGSDGITGISFYTDGSQSIGFTSGGTYNLTLTMSAGGSSSGSLPASIPVDWDFDISTTNPGISVNDWSLTFEMSSSGAGGSNLGTVTEMGSGTGTFEGADTLKLSGAPPSSLYETAVLTVGISGSSSGNIDVDVVAGSSFDFNGAPVPASTPEPASFGLFGAGVAFMGALLRRRRKAA